MAGFIEGHNGIFEVTINSKVIYTNQKQCGRLPTKEEVLHEISTYKDLLPKKRQ
jgi:hypothetical protein